MINFTLPGFGGGGGGSTERKTVITDPAKTKRADREANNAEIKRRAFITANRKPTQFSLGANTNGTGQNGGGTGQAPSGATGSSGGQSL